MIKDKKSMTMLFIIYLYFTKISAQSLAPQSINSSGGKMLQNNAYLSYTIGETVILSKKDNQGYYLGSGFSTSAAISTEVIEEPLVEKIQISVYPNPTTSIIQIEINELNANFFIVNMIDFAGKEVFVGKYSSMAKNIQINCSSFSPGSYFLQTRTLENERISLHKIIKH